MQYLYGSGEASAISLQAYRALWNYLHVEIGYRRDKSQVSSVVLSRGATLTSPKFDLCGKRKLAVVLDVDETALLNVGFEYDAARNPAPYDQARWTRWEQTGGSKVTAVPGAAETLAAARSDGITVIFNTNRSTSTAAQTAAAIEGAGLGPAVLGETLWLREDGAPSGKDERRWKIAETYCVIAMVGDQLGDFSDLFNSPEFSVSMRRNIAKESLLAPLWGAGWFVLPNPVYGSALHGGLDDVFPKDKQWADPAEEKK
ncbi:MAG: acid phosphatase [Sphingomonadales bacterium]|nr:MAG: acid phosphatase [Sphingomonadales bacterium]